MNLKMWTRWGRGLLFCKIQLASDTRQLILFPTQKSNYVCMPEQMENIIMQFCYRL